MAKRSRWREGAPAEGGSKTGRIKELLVLAQRDGLSLSDAEVVATLASRKVRVTSVLVQEGRTELRAEARAAAASVLRPEGRPGQAVGQASSSKPRRPTRTRAFLERVEFVAARRPAVAPDASPSGVVERGPASLSPFSRSSTSARQAGGSRVARVRSKRRKGVPGPSGGRGEVRVGINQTQRVVRELPILDVHPCPACGFRPTINGVCGC